MRGWGFARTVAESYFWDYGGGRFRDRRPPGVGLRHDLEKGRRLLAFLRQQEDGDSEALGRAERLLAHLEWWCHRQQRREAPTFPP